MYMLRDNRTCNSLLFLDGSVMYILLRNRTLFCTTETRLAICAVAEKLAGRFSCNTILVELNTWDRTPE